MSKRIERSGPVHRSRLFPTTHWTDILSAQAHDESQRQEALEELLGRYWKPVYCYLRYRGYQKEDAKDLTQGFFHEIVLGRGLFQRADRAKGRFRTFILRTLTQYVAGTHRAEKTKGRMPEGGLVRLQDIDALGLPEPLHGTTPEDVFDYTWASTLLDQVLVEVGGECHETGMATHWRLFRATVLQPIMDGVESRPLAQLCGKLKVPDEGKASNMIVTVKRRLRGVLRRHLRQFVGSDSEIDEEIRDLMKIFRGGAAS
jgi:DNA-directed RNA polymerase specialized sigma24 family protein